MSAKYKKPVQNSIQKEEFSFLNSVNQIMETACSAYIFSMLCLFPIYMEKKYLNMGEAKYHFFKYTSIFFLGFLFTVFLIKIIYELIFFRDKINIKKIINDISVTDWFVFGYIVFAGISFLLSSDKEMAGVGFQGWFMGLFSQFIFVMIFYFISRYWKWNSRIMVAGLITGAIVYLIAVLQRFDLDIFKLYMNPSGGYQERSDMYIIASIFLQLFLLFIFILIARCRKWNTTITVVAFIVSICIFWALINGIFGLNILECYIHLTDPDLTYNCLADKYIEKFVSTLGQTTWYSSYAVLIMPFGIHAYYVSKNMFAKILSALFIVAGAASLCTVNSDSAYIAIVIILMVYFWFSIKDAKELKIFLEVVLFILATFRGIGILQNIFPERMITLISGEEQITSFVNHSTAMLVLLIAVAALYAVFLYFYLKSYDERMDKYYLDISKLLFLRKVMIYGAIVSVWLVVFLIILTSRQKLPSFLSALYNVNFFNFNMDWGNCRGFNWTMAIRAFLNASFKDVLVGVGPDCFAWAMDKYCYQEVLDYWNGLKLACAHNEWLNMLVNQGVFGLVTYLGIFISSFARLGKSANNIPSAIPCMAAIAAYAGHNFFCYQTCLCTPFIFMIMGIGEMLIISYKKQEAAK